MGDSGSSFFFFYVTNKDYCPIYLLSQVQVLSKLAQKEEIVFGGLRVSDGRSNARFPAVTW